MPPREIPVGGVSANYGPAQPYQDAIRLSAQQAGISEQLLRNILQWEHQFVHDPNVTTGAPGVRGIAQIQDSTATRYGINNRDATGSIMGMGQLLRRFANPAEAIIAYNAGDTALQRWINGQIMSGRNAGQPDPNNPGGRNFGALPYETQRYLEQVLQGIDPGRWNNTFSGGLNESGMPFGWGQGGGPEEIGPETGTAVFSDNLNGWDLGETGGGWLQHLNPGWQPGQGITADMWQTPSWADPVSGGENINTGPSGGGGGDIIWQPAGGGTGTWGTPGGVSPEVGWAEIQANGNPNNLFYNPVQQNWGTFTGGSGIGQEVEDYNRWYEDVMGGEGPAPPTPFGSINPETGLFNSAFSGYGATGVPSLGFYTGQGLRGHGNFSPTMPQPDRNIPVPQPIYSPGTNQGLFPNQPLFGSFNPFGTLTAPGGSQGGAVPSFFRGGALSTWPATIERDMEATGSRAQERSLGREWLKRDTDSRRGMSDEEFMRSRSNVRDSRGGVVPRAVRYANGFAMGGGAPVMVRPYVRKAGQRGGGKGGFGHGLIKSSVPGRTDKIPMEVTGGSYVLPADVVSGVGENNTMAGGKKLDKLFGQGPYQSGATPSLSRKAPSFMPQKSARLIRQRFASGGKPKTPIIVAGGEYLLHADTVAQIGDGDPERGFEILDAFVKAVRDHNVKTLKKLPGPKR
jgi:hypothetical protein